MAALKNTAATAIFYQLLEANEGSRGAPLETALQDIQNLGVADILEWLIVIAVAVALRGGDVAIFVVVVGGCRRQFFGFAVFLLGRPFVFVASTHVIASDRNGLRSCPTIR
jgi:hypothetical protein